MLIGLSYHVAKQLAECASPVLQRVALCTLLTQRSGTLRRRPVDGGQRLLVRVACHVRIRRQPEPVLLRLQPIHQNLDCNTGWTSDESSRLLSTLAESPASRRGKRLSWCDTENLQMLCRARRFSQY